MQETEANFVNALHQFAKIDTCGWALPMLGRLGGDDGEDCCPGN